MKWLGMLSGALLGLVIPASADTYVVHPDGTGDFPTIQAAINAVEDGDIIELTEGTFTGDGNRNIDYLGKAIIVRSQSGDPQACVIDCQQAGRGFYFHSHERSRSILEGVTIANGVGEGGGVYCRYNTSPTFRTLILRGNSGDFGGGMACQSYSSPTLTDVIFTGNSGWAGGGIACHGASPILHDVTLIGNDAWYGGGMYCVDDSSPLLTGATLYGNSGQDGGGIYSAGNSSVWMQNVIIAFGAAGAAVYCGVNSSATLACCDVFGNAGGDWVGCIEDQVGIKGNISEDPLFCDPDNGDFTLDECSPCAPFSPPNPGCDLIGAWPVGCGGGSPAVQSTWGAVKALFRK